MLSSRTLPEAEAGDHPALAGAAAPARVPWYVYAVALAAASTQIGLLWDLSWHMSIGRDTFWTAPHVALYLGGIIPGVTAAWLVLRATFAAGSWVSRRSVRMWGLRGPVGAWVALWGGLAMLTSAPLDDWWHRTYGLDTDILSPPHILLLLGMLAVQLGGLLLAAALANGDERFAGRALERLHVFLAGMLVHMAAFFILVYSFRTYMHGSIFYQVCAAAFPLFLVGATATGRRWAMTEAALVYCALRLAMVWILPLFPAQPQIGPIRFPTTHFVPPDFPLLLVVPAVGMDLLRRRLHASPRWFQAAILGAGFLALLLAAQWPFADFLMSPGARNWVFAADNLRFDLSPATYTARNLFFPWDASVAGLAVGLLVALALACASARVGLWYRDGLMSVRR